MDTKFQEELDSLKRQLLEMGAKVERNIGDAIKALLQRDGRLAEEVRQRDPEIDLTEIEIDQQCLNLLALHQPVARDLRFIATAMKIVKDLERIGDMAKDIAQRALAVIHEEPIRGIDEFPQLAECAQKMLTKALDSFVHQDVELARQVIKDDDVVDELHDRVFSDLIVLMIRDSHKIARATHLIYVTKYLERIGDHSSNMAEMVVFMVKGEDIRHLEKIRKLVESKGKP